VGLSTIAITFGIVVGGATAISPLSAQQPAVAAQFHPPAERSNAASMESLEIPSHGASLNAFMYIAAGAGPHPVAVLLHGLPGNERNLDLAQDVWRAGWNVLYMDYRGSWGSQGAFSFSHSVEDVEAAITYLREPSRAAMLRLDPRRIVLVGHSMGGFVAVQVAASDSSIEGLALISPVDFGGMVPKTLTKDREPMALKGVAAGIAHQGLAPLSGCTPEGLARDVLDHSSEWAFASRAPSLKNRSILLVTSDDGWTDSNDRFAKELHEAGNTSLTTYHLPTDHSYSDQRGALSKDLLEWLAGLPSQ
jgi:uncharacterized protein